MSESGQDPEPGQDQRLGKELGLVQELGQEPMPGQDRAGSGAGFAAGTGDGEGLEEEPGKGLEEEPGQETGQEPGPLAVQPREVLIPFALAKSAANFLASLRVRS